MTVPAWQQALFERRGAGVKFDLVPIRAAHRALGSPADQLTVVHVVGTNGKGSTAAMCAHALTRRGRTVGLFTSPHLHRLGERVRIDGAPMDDDALRVHIDAVLREGEGAEGTRALTFFELITLAAVVAFRAEGVDVAVLEAGVGGRLDSTRIASRPAVVAVTTIGVDHVRYLGPTIADIARDKACAIQPGVPCFSAPQRPEAAVEIERAAARVGAPLSFVTPLAAAPAGLPGEHQRINGALALACARALEPAVDVADLEGVSWPGRLERLAIGGGVVVLDVAHNEDGVAVLVAHARAAPRPPAGRAVLFGCMRDKDAGAMLATLASLGDPIWLTAAASFRAAAPEALAEQVDAAAIYDGVEACRPAITRHLARGGELWVCGSVYLVAEVRAALLELRGDAILLDDPIGLESP